MLPSIFEPCVYGVWRSICFKLDCFRGGERMSLLRVRFADVALLDRIAPDVRAGVCATIFGPFFHVCVLDRGAWCSDYSGTMGGRDVLILSAFPMKYADLVRCVGCKGNTGTGVFRPN